MPFQVGKCILKNKIKNWHMDMNGWKLGVGQLIREYWDVNCGNYFYFQIKTWVCG